MIFAPLPSDANNGTKATVAAVYVQDQIRISPMVRDRRRPALRQLQAEGRRSSSRRECGIQPQRQTLVAAPRPDLQAARKSVDLCQLCRSYLPQSGDQFSGLDLNTEALKPERFDNYEIGAKWEPVEGLLATAAIYRLDRTNTRVARSPARACSCSAASSAARASNSASSGSISDNWQVSAGYAWQKAEVIEATTACNPAGDCKVPLVPRHSFSLWTRYDSTKQLGVGLGVIARSKTFASISNTVKLPGYARVDAALFYKMTDEIEAQINVENIFGADYFATAHSDNNIAPGAPTTAKFAVKLRLLAAPAGGRAQPFQRAGIAASARPASAGRG